MIGFVFIFEVFLAEGLCRGPRLRPQALDTLGLTPLSKQVIVNGILYKATLRCFSAKRKSQVAVNYCKIQIRQ